MAKQTKAKADTIARVMDEFKRGELTIGAHGPPVTNPKQAIAVALREAGSSNTQTPTEQRAALRRTKRGERAARTSATRATLYAEARRRGIPGCSTMSKAELEAALR